MPIRASDFLTLAVLPSPSYVRAYYRKQASNLAAPAKPTTNPPAAPWSTVEPGYDTGSTDTLYTVMLTAYGSVAFEYGDVQKSSSYEAAKQAYNLAHSTNQSLGTARGELDTLNNTTLPGLNNALAQKLPIVSDIGGVKTYRDVFSLYSSASGAPGSLVVRTTIPFTGAMLRARFECGQLTGGDVSGEFSLYAYSNQTIYQPAYTSTGARPVRMRFAKTAHTGGYLVLIFDLVDGSTWRYPRFSVPEMQVGYVYPDGIGEGWVGTFTNDLSDLVGLTNASISRDLNDTHTLTQGWRTTGKTTIDGGNITADSIVAGKLATNAVVAGNILAGAVTTDKMTANTINGDRIATNSLHAGKIVTGSITTDQMTANTINGDRILTNSLHAGRITAGSITTDRMTANTISGDRIAANTLNASKIVAGSIATDRMTANSINGDRIATNTLHAGRIIAGSITTDRMTADSINGDRIAANTLHASKITAFSIDTDRMAANSIDGNRIKANTLDAGKITAGTIDTFRMTADSINGDRIKANTLHADKIIAETITANKLHADAINGKTITGATIRTGTGTSRIEMDSGNRFRFFHPEGGESLLLPGDYGLAIQSGGATVSVGSGAAVGGVGWGGVHALSVRRTGAGDNGKAIISTDVVMADAIVQGTRLLYESTTAITGGNSYVIDVPASILSRIGDRVELSVLANRSAGVAQARMCSIPSEWAPTSTITVLAAVSQGGSATSLVTTITPSGDVMVWGSSTLNKNIAVQASWRAK